MADPKFTPTQQQMGTTFERPWYQFGIGRGDELPVYGYQLSPEAAGSLTPLEQAQYYDYMRRAAAQGQDVYGQQQNLANALLARAQGRGAPSLAEQQTLAQNRADLQGQLAAQGRGMNPATAQRLLLSKGADLQQQAAGQGAILRAQEQLAAQTALANQLSNMGTAQQNMFSQAGTLGLNQAKSVADLAEAQKNREYNLAVANLAAATGGKSAEMSAQQSAQNTAAKTAGDVAQGVAAGINEYNKTKNAPVGPSAPSGKAQGGLIRQYAEGGEVLAKTRKPTAAEMSRYNKAVQEDAKRAKKQAEQIKKFFIEDDEDPTNLPDDMAEEMGISKSTLQELKKIWKGEKPLSPAMDELHRQGQREAWKQLQLQKLIGEDEELSKKHDLDDPFDPKLKAQKEAARKDIAERRAKMEAYDPEKEPGLPDDSGSLDVPEALRPSTEEEIKRGKIKKKIDEMKGVVGVAQGGKIHAAMGHLSAMDNKKNDTVPAMLSPGEIVLPRSIVNSPNAPLAAAKFVEALLSKKDKKSAKMDALKAALSAK
jgi:hypothetical protein